MENSVKPSDVIRLCGAGSAATLVHAFQGSNIDDVPRPSSSDPEVLDAHVSTEWQNWEHQFGSFLVKLTDPSRS